MSVNQLDEREKNAFSRKSNKASLGYPKNHSRVRFTDIEVEMYERGFPSRDPFGAGLSDERKIF